MTSVSPLDPALATWFTQHDARLQDELFAFLRIPSVSARTEHTADVARAASWLHGHLARIGFTVETLPTAGHPVVLAEWRRAPAGAPTVLVYGHYDVQPAEPLELWTSPAFEPTLRDGNIYARGSVDDKGQLWLHVAALEAHLATRGALPVNVIVLAEGEEEVGSEHLAPFIEAHQARLACDAVVISDSTMFAPGIPSILSSLRGLAYFQVDVTGPASDLHSGMYGGAVVNPATALARIIASFHDAEGRVAIPGFYDQVRPFPDAVRDGMRKLPFDEADFTRHLEVAALGGEPGFTTLEKLWTRPTCELNGLLSGYTGEGAKTVLPGRAMAKVSCRLVPDQDPATVARLFEAHVRAVTPAGVTVTVTTLHGGHPWRADLSGPLYDAAARALSTAFGREPVVTGEGGSIPVVNDFERLLGAPVLLVGFGLPGENAHAPDEWISQDNFRRGMRAIAALWDELGPPVGAMTGAYDALAAVSRTLPGFRGKGRVARAIHRRLRGHAIARDPMREIVMRDGSRARWDLRDDAEAMAFWLGEADDAERAALLARVPADAVVFDVGANVGWWTVPLARRLAPHGGRVVAFEPVPANRARLEWAIAANAMGAQVEIVPVALGDAPAELGMWLKSAETGAGSGTAALVAPGGEAHLRVPVVTLDAWAAERAPIRCDLMKLDIEGAELMMLRGAERFIAGHRPLIFGEFEAYWLSTFGSSFLDVAAWAARMDYRILKWEPHRFRFTPLERVEVGVQDVLLEPRV